MALQAILFDLDNTLYPASCGLIREVEQRIRQFVMANLQIDESAALALCRHYYATYGTTLRGLQLHYDHIEPETYLAYIHQVAVDECVAPNPTLAAKLASLPLRKVIFTNSVEEYAAQVLTRIGIADQFERIWDVRSFSLVGKSDPAAYHQILGWLGLPGGDVMMIEDSHLNLGPAKALGMTTVLIDEPMSTVGTADYVVPDVLAALAIAEDLLSHEHAAFPASN